MTQKTQYGSILIGHPERHGTHWGRRDQYVSDELGPADGRDLIWCAGADDRSPQRTTWPHGYDHACNWCYLGYGHSEREHARQVAR